MKYRVLTDEEERVILRKGTERPFTGKYENHFEAGVYVCRQCNTPLFPSGSKFHSDCGWPSFDDALPGAVKQIPDADGRRTEIVCSYCNGHLGHVFRGEGFTPNNTRHCVNSVSLDFLPEGEMTGQAITETAIFGAGCFWGVEYYLKRAEGVVSTRCGYAGGTVKNPSYREVCNHTTGHAEVVEVVFDPRKTSFEELARLFFEIHDPTQLDRQGPDIGEQYRSVIFYTLPSQKVVAEKLMDLLIRKGYELATELLPAAPFYPAEDYHQDYYDQKGGIPYCHRPEKRF